MKMTRTRLEIRDMIDTAALAEQDFTGTLATIKQKVTDYQNVYEGYRSNILERLENFKDLEPEVVLYLFKRSDITLLMRAWRSLNSMLYSLSIKGWALPDTSFSENEALTNIGFQYKSIFGVEDDESSIADRYGRYFLMTSNSKTYNDLIIPSSVWIEETSRYVENDFSSQYIYRSKDTEEFNPMPLCYYNWGITDTQLEVNTAMCDPASQTVESSTAGTLYITPPTTCPTPERWQEIWLTEHQVSNAESFFSLPEFAKMTFTEGVDPEYVEFRGYYRYDYRDDDPHHTGNKQYLRLSIASVADIVAAHETYGDIYTRDFRPGLYTYDPNFSWYDTLKSNSIITMEINPRKMWKGYWGSGKGGWSSIFDDLMVKESYRESGWADAAYNLAADAAFLIHNYDIDHKVDITQLFTLLTEQEQCKALFQIGNIWAVRHQIVRVICTQLMKLYKYGRIGRSS